MSSTTGASAWKSPTAESRILPLTYEELPYALPKDYWKKDESTLTCTDCKKNFHFLYRRRHHCRRCGFIFCDSCCSKLCTYVNLDRPQRICRLCRTILVTNAVRNRHRRIQSNPPPPPSSSSLGSTAVGETSDSGSSKTTNVSTVNLRDQTKITLSSLSTK